MTYQTKFILSFFLGLFACLNSVVYGQNVDSLRQQMHQFLQESEQLFEVKNFRKARIYAENASEIAQKINQKSGLARALFWAGKSAQQEKKFPLAADYLIQSHIEYEILKNTDGLTKTAYQIGNLYFEHQLWQNAQEYLVQAQESIGNSGKNQALIQPIWTQLAECAFQQNDYAQALKYDSLRWQKYPHQITVYHHFMKIFIAQKAYAKAYLCNQNTIKFYEKTGNNSKLAQAYNNAGFLAEKQGNSEQASRYFNQSVALYRLINPRRAAPIYLNLGVLATQNNQYTQAESYFEEALQLFPKSSSAELAELYAYMGINAYLAQNPTRAFDLLNKSVEVAQQAKSPKQLRDSYKILAELHRKNEDFRDYQKYDKLYEQLDDSLQNAASRLYQELAEIREQTQKKESDLKVSVAHREQQASELKRLRIEAEKRENDLKLLSQERELEKERLTNAQLEREKVSQLLELAEQKLRTDRQKQEAENQRQEASKQKLIAEKQRIQTQQKSKELRASKTLQVAQAKQLEQEKSIRYYGMALLVLGAILLMLILIGFLNSRRTNRQLAQKNDQIEASRKEIETQNEELHQNQEEILAQRDFIAKQNQDLKQTNDELGKQNAIITNQSTKINASIRYAQTIQRAILPNSRKLYEVVEDYFIIYLPKDMVSGDFYWRAKADNYRFIAVADCTGHGVPGAFMSMIGYAQLNKIIGERRVYDTAQIMTHLHDEIIQALGQEEGKNRDGMDVCLCRLEILENGETEIQFTGAKQNLLVYQHQNLEIIKGDRRSVGGIQNINKSFTTNRLSLKKGTLYLFSDGFIDQNNPRRHKYGRVNFERLIRQVAPLPLAQQEQEILSVLRAHQGDEEQRDDITIMAISVG